MGLIQWLGAASGARALAQTFVADRTEGQAQDHAKRLAAIDALGREFARKRRGGFDDFVDGLNRLPRPVMALSTIGFMGFSMVDPVAFGVRMEGLSLVPGELWWLLGAIVSFYFGGRELHHFRGLRQGAGVADVARAVDNIAQIRALDAPTAPVSDAEASASTPHGSKAPTPSANAAINDWRREMARDTEAR
ncbi:MAG: holin family protein [Pseudomonadota bacterium]